jgi:hypothetical protein
MAGPDPQSSDQFSLVSLEKSQKAANSYASMSQRVRGEGEGNLNINEHEAKPKTAPLPPPPKTAEISEKKQSPPKTFENEQAHVDQSIDDMLARLEEFNQLASTLFANFRQVSANIAIVILTPLIPLLNKLLQLLNGPVQFINLLARKINEKMGRKSPTRVPGVSTNEQGDAFDAVSASPPPPPAPVVSARQANYSDMLELNIIFTDNMKKPLYKKKPNTTAMRLGAMEEDLIMSNAILAINECAEFTLELPAPSTGLFAGQRIYDIMANVTKNDVSVFLGFVKAFPGKYIGKEWKISETFATWLINNAPTAE